MDRRHFGRAGLLASLAGLFTTRASAQETKPTAEPIEHRLVIKVSTDDHKVQALALGNAANYGKFYRDQNEPFDVEIVAFGPGFAMMHADVSQVKSNIEHLQQNLGATLTLSACQNSRRMTAETEGKTIDQIPQLPGVKDTPAGIVRVAALQEQGWSYVRP